MNRKCQPIDVATHDSNSHAIALVSLSLEPPKRPGAILHGQGQVFHSVRRERGGKEIKQLEGLEQWGAISELDLGR